MRSRGKACGKEQLIMAVNGELGREFFASESSIKNEERRGASVDIWQWLYGCVEIEKRNFRCWQSLAVVTVSGSSKLTSSGRFLGWACTSELLELNTVSKSTDEVVPSVTSMRVTNGAC